ncbi:MAG TPA: hypothetical protein VGH23_16095 [Rhizomicrobium sp.]|jgi:hypothetical protein
MDLSNPKTQALIGAVIRAILVAAGGGGLMSGDQISSLAGALAVVAGLGWSLWQKRNSVSHATLTTAVQQTASNPQNASAIIAAAKQGHF